MIATPAKHSASDPQEPAGLDSYLTLGEAAKVAPGRPSANCVWRWCRRGVLARSGERIQLQHLRVGGKIFTTDRWVREFGRRLAEADAVHFQRRQGIDSQALQNEGAASSPRDARGAHLDYVDRTLTEEGL